MAHWGEGRGRSSRELVGHDLDLDLARRLDFEATVLARVGLCQDLLFILGGELPPLGLRRHFGRGT